jgi:flagellar secretion chaperone FliS
MSNLTTAHDRYKSASVETMSPGRLLVALYDRLLIDLERAVLAIVAEDPATSHMLLVHAQEIVTELAGSLNVEVWPAGEKLASLYEWVLKELVEANVSKDAARVIVCHDLLLPLRDAWNEAAGVVGR